MQNFAPGVPMPGALQRQQQPPPQNQGSDSISDSDTDTDTEADERPDDHIARAYKFQVRARVKRGVYDQFAAMLQHVRGSGTQSVERVLRICEMFGRKRSDLVFGFLQFVPKDDLPEALRLANHFFVTGQKLPVRRRQAVGIPAPAPAPAPVPAPARNNNSKGHRHYAADLQLHGLRRQNRSRCLEIVAEIAAHSQTLPYPADTGQVHFGELLLVMEAFQIIGVTRKGDIRRFIDCLPHPVQPKVRQLAQWFAHQMAGNGGDAQLARATYYVQEVKRRCTDTKYQCFLATLESSRRIQPEGDATFLVKVMLSVFGRDDVDLVAGFITFLPQEQQARGRQLAQEFVDNNPLIFFGASGNANANVNANANANANSNANANAIADPFANDAVKWHAAFDYVVEVKNRLSRAGYERFLDILNSAQGYHDLPQVMLNVISVLGTRNFDLVSGFIRFLPPDSRAECRRLALEYPDNDATTDGESSDDDSL